MAWRGAGWLRSACLGDLSGSEFQSKSGTLNFHMCRVRTRIHSLEGCQKGGKLKSPTEARTRCCGNMVFGTHCSTHVALEQVFFPISVTLIIPEVTCDLFASKHIALNLILGHSFLNEHLLDFSSFQLLTATFCPLNHCTILPALPALKSWGEDKVLS